MADDEKEGSENRSRVSRRQFLKTAAVGAAAVGIAAAVPSAATVASGLPQGVGSPEEFEGAEGLVADQTGSIVAYVRNPSKGEVVLMIGENEVVRRDFRLVAQLTRLARVTVR